MTLPIWIPDDQQIRTRSDLRRLLHGYVSSVAPDARWPTMWEAAYAAQLLDAVTDMIAEDPQRPRFPSSWQVWNAWLARQDWPMLVAAASAALKLGHTRAKSEDCDVCHGHGAVWSAEVLSKPQYEGDPPLRTEVCSACDGHGTRLNK